MWQYYSAPDGRPNYFLRGSESGKSVINKECYWFKDNAVRINAITVHGTTAATQSSQLNQTTPSLSHSQFPL